MSLIRDVREGVASLQQSPRDLKQFGLTMAIVLAILATLIYIFGDHAERSLWLSILSLLFLLFAFLFPRSLKPLHTVWMGLAFFLGWFMSRILLTVLYFFILTPIGLLLRLFGKDLLDLKLDKHKESYWIRRDSRPSVDRYEKMF